MATEEYAPKLPVWDTYSGQYIYSASGKREVLLIAPTLSSPSPEVVPRRPQELSEHERWRLEYQGVPRDCHHDDLSLIEARYNLDKDLSLFEVLTGRSITCKQVMKKASQLMNKPTTVGGKL